MGNGTVKVIQPANIDRDRIYQKQLINRRLTADKGCSVKKLLNFARVFLKWSIAKVLKTP
ncbi:hypothetical protein BJP37_26275 [Moorena bouillonii PNG]|uniref:Uncharacterized protein n=1 Tax=Moorena bouillonii PNG TaxID=568701 RepID=A0A1U7N7U2_9CYAN|nr:hypothetical protein BJP37_26275 [Moorena bouillonii PNG]